MTNTEAQKIKWIVRARESITELTESIELIELTTDELDTMLDALAFARAAKLKQHDTEGTEPVLRVLYDGDALPPRGTLDGDILRIGALLLKMQGEAMHGEMTAKADALPTEFDGDPKL